MKAGRSLESYVQFVYQKLLEFMEEGTLVSTNVSIVGKTGARHEFDVYYEFIHLNLKHAVAIECKDWLTPVTVGEVRDFCGKLEDLNRVSGMMVSRSGYQAGARQYARGKGIELLEEKDLPTFTSIVAGVIKNGFLPDKTVRGAPFWTLMEVRKDEVTGTYYALPGEKPPVVPLFYSRTMAEKLLEKLPDRDRFEVRGVSQYQLRSLTAQMEAFGVQAGICCMPYWQDDPDQAPFVLIPTELLRTEYLDP